MRIALLVISFFILVPELYASSLDVHEELSIRQNLEEAREELIPPFYYDPKASPYAAPQTALNDRMFVTVEEYPDGYTGSSVFRFNDEICGEISYEPTCNYIEAQYQGPNWPLKFVRAARVKNDTDHHIMITTDCTKVWTGFFALKECFPAFIQCSVGTVRTQSCDNYGGVGMVFDDRIKNCVSMEACKAPLEGKFRGVKMQTLQCDDEPKTRELREMIPEFVPFTVTTDCSKKTFGSNVYEVGKCHRNVVMCRNGVPLIEACPGNFSSVFSLRKGTCIEKKECEETWDDWSEKLLSPSNNTVIPMQKKEHLSLYRRPEEIVLVPTGKECVGKKNGRYAMSPCQAEYMSCFMESGYKMKCSEGFVFSRRFLECVGKEFCEE
ncbi:hypothetical protein CAEBREN_08698 [Caenorhabditis brenneri]|uniref:Chitin-binding type-2 domain-containing protein n=1 Tax=Caenorhabditis brenneri TaxID=135651 RepID=G0NXH4_CAEBE|nr:hypothetical protein CAEBREN_08698 [Caenorhabditis brenneri]